MLVQAFPVEVRMKSQTTALNLLITLLCLFLSKLAVANQLHVNLSYYWDDRDFNTATLQFSAPQLPAGFSVWGFTDFHSEQQNSAERYEFERSFSEYRISNIALADWTGIDGLGLQAEYNYFRPGSNSAWRGGITYKRPLGEWGWTQLRLFPFQSQDEGQASLTYFIAFTEDFNLSGFADYNLRAGKSNQWVIEPQLSYRILKDTWLLLEYRYNGFEIDNATLDGNGIAAGVRYDF